MGPTGPTEKVFSDSYHPQVQEKVTDQEPSLSVKEAYQLSIMAEG